MEGLHKRRKILSEMNFSLYINFFKDMHIVSLAVPDNTVQLIDYQSLSLLTWLSTGLHKAGSAHL